MRGQFDVDEAHRRVKKTQLLSKRFFKEMTMRSMMLMMMMGSINAHSTSPFYTDSAGKGCTAVPVDKCDAKNNCLGTFFVYDETRSILKYKPFNAYIQKKISHKNSSINLSLVRINDT